MGFDVTNTPLESFTKALGLIFDFSDRVKELSQLLLSVIYRETNKNLKFDCNRKRPVVALSNSVRYVTMLDTSTFHRTHFAHLQQSFFVESIFGALQMYKISERLQYSDLLHS